VRAVGRIRALAAICVALVIVAGCGSLFPSRPAITCAEVPDPACSDAITLVTGAFSHDVGSASAMVVADTCPPAAECDRQSAIDLAVVIVPADPSRPVNALHVFGTRRPETIEPWPGDLPAHVKALLPGR
jgi:hypothetical protein